MTDEKILRKMAHYLHVAIASAENSAIKGDDDTETCPDCLEMVDTQFMPLVAEAERRAVAAERKRSVIWSYP